MIFIQVVVISGRSNLTTLKFRLGRAAILGALRPKWSLRRQRFHGQRRLSDVCQKLKRKPPRHLQQASLGVLSTHAICAPSRRDQKYAFAEVVRVH